MLTEKQLDDLLAIFLERSQSVVEEYLIRMGEQIREIGELIPSSINRLVQLKKMNANMDAIKREIARLAEISIQDLEKIFEAAQETDARFMAKEFGNEFKKSILQMPALRQILEAQFKITAGSLANLSQTHIVADGYRRAIDKAIQAAQMGVEDYNSSIRRALVEAAGEGLRVEVPGTSYAEARVGYGGKYTRRLDSAVRQNVLDGIRSLNNATLMQLGEEFGADGVEISAHALCAEDHLPYQGQQYSMEAFEQRQEDLPRPFGMWNCKHSMHPILLGISQSAYTEEELEEYRKFSEEKITIDGITHTRYEWSQQQRRIETAVRRQKDVAVAARAAGDNVQRRKSQQVINALTEKYKKVSEAADLNTEFGRMRVSGFKAMTAKQLQSVEITDILKSTKERIRSDSVSKRINPEKQNRHVKTADEYTAGRSYIYGDADTAQALVNKYHGTGEPQIDKNGKWKNKEVVEIGTDIGVDIDRDTGNQTTTNRFVIHYSKTGTHIVPTARKEPDDGRKA